MRKNVIRFPVERTRPAPLYAARLFSADVLLLPTVRIERQCLLDENGNPLTPSEPPKRPRRRRRAKQ